MDPPNPEKAHQESWARMCAMLGLDPKTSAAYGSTDANYTFGFVPDNGIVLN